MLVQIEKDKLIELVEQAYFEGYEDGDENSIHLGDIEAVQYSLRKRFNSSYSKYQLDQLELKECLTNKELEEKIVKLESVIKNFAAGIKDLYKW